MSVDLLCMGEPMLEFNQLPPTRDGARHYLEGHGGDTSNAAIAAARQGARVGYITAVGHDMPGDSFMALWAREGVDTTTVRRDPRHQTGVYFVTHDMSGHHFLHYRANSPAAMLGAADVPDQAIRAARMLYASGISQGISPTARAGVARAMDIAAEAGVPIAYDTNYRPRLWSATQADTVMRAAMRQVTHALPGIEDARVMTGLTDPDSIVDLYQSLGPKVVVLKLGEAGAYVATATERVAIPPFPVRVVDATGAGDTFCGAYLARVLAGDPPVTAARYAAVAAALKCQGYGAVAPIPRAEAVRAALAGWNAPA
jgi:2-dehydro-3-deoxygluconokinase